MKKYIAFASVFILACIDVSHGIVHAQGGATEIAPHRALYEIDLVSKRSGAQILNVDGEMMYEWQPACEGWNTQHRFNLFYEYTDSPAAQITSDFSTFESFDGKSLNFSSRRKSDNILLDQYRGHAAIGEGAGGEVIYTIPDDLAHDLPTGTLFPTQHTLQMVEALKSGDKFFSATVFDGSDETGAVQVNSFIGAKAPASDIKQGKEIKVGLLQSAAHNVRLAFFPQAREEATPEYEMDMVVQENGVIGEMLIHYDDFSVRQTLKALKAVKGKCLGQSLNQ